jgi:hypothetical protein
MREVYAALHAWAFWFTLAAVMILFAAACQGVFARDLGQWANEDQAIASWFRDLKQPDHPTISCCSFADAYYADIDKTGPNGELIAVITDDRPDGPLGRPHIPVGTEVVIPKEKIKYDKGNPTDHVIVFIGSYGYEDGPASEPSYVVYCYVQNGSI